MTTKEIIAIITDLIVAIPLIVGLFYLIYLILRGKDINKVLNTNPKLIFETIIILAIILEVLSLSILGLERGIALSSCLSRYGLAGTLEIFMSFLVSTSIAKALSDGKINGYEVLELIVLMIFTVFSNFIIYLFYLEANGNLRFLGVFDYSSKAEPVELGALFIIWLSIPLNIMNIFFQVKTFNEEKASIAKKKEEEKKKKESDELKKKDDKNKEKETEEEKKLKALLKM